MKLGGITVETLEDQVETMLEWTLPAVVKDVLRLLMAERNPYCPESGRIVDGEYGVSDDHWTGKATVCCKGCDEAMSATRIQGSNDYMIPRHKW